MTFINVDRAEEAEIPVRCGRATGARDVLAAISVLADLPHDAVADLARHATLARYANGETLFYEGDDASHCLAVAQGAVEVLRYGEAGDERMLHRFDPGLLVAEAAMFMPHGLYPMTGRADGDTEVWRIPRKALRSTCEQHPVLALRLLEVLSMRLYRRVNDVEWLASSSAPQRLAAYLVAQAQRQGSDIHLPTSQRHLAAHLGIRAETLNRMLSEWQGKGWVCGGRRHWRLQEMGPLRALAAPAARAF